MIHIILFQPEKPQNVGNIIRTVSITESKLIIIGPLTFSLDDKLVKRVGMSYFDHGKIKYYDNYVLFLKDYKNKDIYYLTRYGKKIYSDINFNDYLKDYYFMFGKESSGIPKEILKNNLEYCLRIPMSISSRSLNLSNCVAIVTYEALRQVNFKNLSNKEVIKGEDFLFY